MLHRLWIYRSLLYPPVLVLLVLLLTVSNAWNYQSSFQGWNYTTSSHEAGVGRGRRSLSAPVDFSHLSPPRIAPDLPPLLRFFDHTGAQVRCQATGNPRPTVKWLVATNFNAAGGGAGDGGGSNTSGDADADYAATVAALHPFELGYSAFVRDAQSMDSRLRGAAADDYHLYDPKSRGLVPVAYPNQYVIDDGWLNFTATPRSSTLRMVFFCEAHNPLGRVRSRKMVIHQVPVPDERLGIRYHSFPVKPGQKAVVRCQPEQEIFNRFLKVKYWEVFRNNSLIATVTHSKDRFSVINATRYPELHIRDITDADLRELGVRCVLQSIVDESREIRSNVTGRLQPFGILFPYEEIRSQSTSVDVLVGSTVELPWVVETSQKFPVQWYWQPASATASSSASSSASASAAAAGGLNASSATSAAMSPGVGARLLLSPPVATEERTVVLRPWGSRLELVQGAYGNLRLTNVAIEDAGLYICEYRSQQQQQILRVVYTLKVRAPIKVRVTPHERVCDYGTRVELECQVSGYPHQIIYWLHNSQLLKVASTATTTTTTANTASGSGTTISRYSVHRRESTGLQTVRERLIINSFSLEDAGVYQCVAESTLADDPDAKVTSGRSGPAGISVPEAGIAKAPKMEPGRVSVGDLVDNAQDTAHLVMGKMKPTRTYQYPSGQIFLSKARGGELNATLECRFAANPLPSIRWFRDDLPLSQAGEMAYDKGVVVAEVVKDAQRPYSLITRLRIDLNQVPPWDEQWQYGGEYRAVANNSLGWADCRTFLLLDTPLRLRPVDSSKPAIAGRHHDLKCYFIGSGIPKLQWHRIKNGQRIERIPVDHRHALLENARVLRITEVNKEEDEAEYRCTAMLGDMTDNITIALQVSRAPRIQDLPEVQRVQAGRQSLTYSCATQNHADRPWYAWWRFQPEGADHAIDLPPDAPLNPGEFQVSYAADLHQMDHRPMSEALRHQLPSFVQNRPNSVVHVRIEQLNKRQHQGTLTCKIVNEVGFDERPIRVTFIPELEFEIRPPNKQDVTLAQNISINCTARPSEPAPMIVWKYSDESTGDFTELASLTERTEGRIYQESNGTLVIAAVEESDPRKFLCFLIPKESTTANPISVAVNLEIHVPARIEPLKDVDAVRGSKFNLTCVVHGDANDLRANWYHRPIGSEHWRLINQTCVLPVSYGEAENAALAMASAYSTDSLVSDPLACQKSAVGRFDSGVVFRQVSVMKQSGRDIELQLQFDSLKDIHMAQYMCNASNFYNRDKEGRQEDVRQVLRLTVISIPDPVTFVQNSSQTTATSVSFSWVPPAHDGNKAILRYWIRYYQADSAAGEATSAPTKPSNVIEVRPHERQATLTGLRPYTKYNIAIKAENEVGLSLENSLVLTTQEAKPEGPVEQLNASGTASDTIYVSWQKPRPEVRNGNVDRYWVCHQRLNETAGDDLGHLPWPVGDHDAIVSDDASMTSGSNPIFCSLLHRQQDTELTGLPKFTAYAIRVIAINSKGQSPPAYVLARTLEDLPQASPTNVTCSTQQHSITVTWDPPNFETVNGILTEYLVNYYIANDFGDETNSVIQVVRGQTTVTLAGLLANTRYVIQVAASNRKGRGPLSPKKTCVTTEAPPEAPENVKALPVNETCVMVSWSHPTRPQGLTRLYCLAAYKQDNLYRSIGSVGVVGGPGASGVVAGPRCVKPDFSKPYNYFLFCDLSPQYLYNISVMAKNRFDGRRAYVSSIAPTSHPSVSIISIGGTIVAQEGMRVLMDCLVSGYPPVEWTFGMIDDVQQLDNGTLIIESVEPRHTGRYVCRHRDDSISYELKVQAVSNDPPKPPVFHKLTPSLRNIQVEWLSPGSRRLDAPITWFHLDWTNEYTGLGDSVKLPADRRTYYLSNLTCATTVRFQMRAENQFGHSAPTEPISVSTEGSAPLFVGETDMVPANLRSQNSVTFNFSVFAPGSNCSPSVYRFRIWPAADGTSSEAADPILIGAAGSAMGPLIGPVAPLHYNLTLTKRDLFSLDNKPWNRRCCYNLTGLHPGSYYQYHVVAENPAGKTPHFGYFWTRTVSGIQPREGASTRLGRASFLAQPTTIVPLTLFLVVLLVSTVCVFFYCRHRRLEAELNPSGAHGAGGKAVGGHQQQGNVVVVDGRRQLIQHPPHIQGGMSKSRHRGTLPPIPVGEKESVGGGGGEYNSDSTTKVSRGGFLGFWGRSTRLYDRGRAGTILPPQSIPPAPIEPDRLSTSSMDSTGNLNPYATYAAGGIEEEPVQAPVVSKSAASLLQSAPLSGGAAGGGGAASGAGGGRSMAAARSMEPGGASGGPTRMYKTFNKGGYQASYMHQYHYPDLGNPEMEGLLEASRHRSVGGAGGGEGAPRARFLPIGDPRLSMRSSSRHLQHHHALLDPPLHQPYVNNTATDDDDVDDDLVLVADEDDMEFFGPHQLLATRRINSFESLQQHSLRQVAYPSATTYHRGYSRARTGGGGAHISTVGGGAGGNPAVVPVTSTSANAAAAAGVFFDTRNPHLPHHHHHQGIDPLTAAYRGSVLSSTTVSSNQDELMQAYEYGRKHGRFLGGGQSQHPRQSMPGGAVGGGGKEGVASAAAVVGNGGSGSSETTDPGICQFTQQPPMPADEMDGRMAANGTIDLSRRMAPPTAAAAGGSTISTRGGGGGGGAGLSAMGVGSEALPAAFLKRQLSECPSELTDTYSSVDYSAMLSRRDPSGPVAKLPTIPQKQQLLVTRLEYPDLESDSGMSAMTRGGGGSMHAPGAGGGGGGAYHRQASQHSYYYPGNTSGVGGMTSTRDGGGSSSYYGQPVMARQHSQPLQQQQQQQRAMIVAASAAVRRQDSMPAGAGVAGSTAGRSRPVQQQQQQYQSRKAVVARSASSSKAPPGASYGSTPRGPPDSRSQQQHKASTSSAGAASTSAEASTGPVQAAEDEENIYTSEFVLV